MDRLDRIYRLHQLLRARRYPVPFSVIQDSLDCSRATARRVISELRDAYAAPVVYDRQGGGYRYDERAGEHPFELPGLWFSADELYALLAAHRLLGDIGPGLLSERVSPLRRRIESLVAQRCGADPAVLDRIRILAQGARRVRLPAFSEAAAGVLRRKRLRFVYHGRARAETTRREVSPQRLTHYRDNWYLDAWCHAADALRIFAVDRIDAIELLERPARDLSGAELDAQLAGAYGIFAGPATDCAVLRFSAERARWVADERWHPEQFGRWLDDGRYELRLPYGDPRELLMDVLKYGADVEVVAPESLRETVAAALRAAHGKYESAGSRSEPAGGL